MREELLENIMKHMEPLKKMDIEHPKIYTYVHIKVLMKLAYIGRGIP